MEVELSHLTATGVPIHGAVRLTEGLGTTAAGGDSAPDGVRFPEPLAVDGRVSRVGDLVLVAAHVAGKAVLQCGRCLTSVEHPLSLDFEARYAPHSAIPKAHGGRTNERVDERLSQLPARGAADETAILQGLVEGGGIQLRADELDISFLPAGAHALVVEDVVREQVLLELPLRPLCKEECRGLCPRCGDDLNAGPCHCGGDPGPGDLRFAALADLKKTLEKN